MFKHITGKEEREVMKAIERRVDAKSKFEEYFKSLIEEQSLRNFYVYTYEKIKHMRDSSFNPYLLTKTILDLNKYIKNNFNFYEEYEFKSYKKINNFYASFGRISFDGKVAVNRIAITSLVGKAFIELSGANVIKLGVVLDTMKLSYFSANQDYSQSTHIFPVLRDGFNYISFDVMNPNLNLVYQQMLAEDYIYAKRSIVFDSFEKVILSSLYLTLIEYANSLMLNFSNLDDYELSYYKKCVDIYLQLNSLKKGLGRDDRAVSLFKEMEKKLLID